ncbi:GreA/GreB family elongation factor [Tenacibaculum sp. ZS6-P6]|uniref:GreA/GreB family elongation factor n=1 Tax=Tenacibaculum sp. ZS6-P6 TaxID=3447503 RepID=UPI003F9446EE
MSIKEKLYQECVFYVEKREQTIQEIISSNKKALLSETKSSAGDKHETGRAMLQLEMEKAGQQIAVVHQMKETLAKVDTVNSHDLVRLGSVIITENMNYFIAISLGKTIIDNKDYFIISSSSPIGKMFLGKKEGDEVVFNGKSITIQSIL